MGHLVTAFCESFYHPVTLFQNLSAPFSSNFPKPRQSRQSGRNLANARDPRCVSDFSVPYLHREMQVLSSGCHFTTMQ
jgi:hypothetical protein